MFRLFPTFLNLGRFLRNNVTRPGRALLFLLFFCAIGLIYLDSPLLYLFTSILSILVLAAIFSFAYRPIFRIHRIVPDLVEARAEVLADYYLTNLRNRPAFEVFLECQESQDPDIEIVHGHRLLNIVRPGKTVRQQLSFRFLRRGLYRLPPVQCGSTFPFNLFRFRQVHQTDEKLIVAPAFRKLQHFGLPSSSHSMDQENEKNLQFAHAIGAAEYVGNREYQEGLPVRRWDFSSWARTGKPTVREYRENQKGSATLFVDSFIDPTDQGSERFEALLSLAMALVEALSRHHVTIGHLVIGSTVHTITEGSNDEQLRQVAQRLALCDTEPESAARALEDPFFADQIAAGQSYAFLLFHRLDPTRERFRSQLLRDGHGITTLLLDQHVSDGTIQTVTRTGIESGGVVIR